MTAYKSFLKYLLCFLGGSVITLAVMLPFVYASKNSNNTISAQEQTYNEITETYYTLCGHKETSYQTVTSKPQDTKKSVIQNYCQKHYLLKAQGDTVYVYLLCDIDAEHIRETDININTLPAADRLALIDGVEAHSDEQLDSLIEDYES